MAGQMSLFDLVSEEEKLEYEVRMPDVKEYEKETLLAFEKRFWACISAANPLEEYDRYGEKSYGSAVCENPFRNRFV